MGAAAVAAAAGSGGAGGGRAQQRREEEGAKKAAAARKKDGAADALPEEPYIEPARAPESAAAADEAAAAAAAEAASAAAAASAAEARAAEVLAAAAAGLTRSAPGATSRPRTAAPSGGSGIKPPAARRKSTGSNPASRVGSRPSSAPRQRPSTPPPDEDLTFRPKINAKSAAMVAQRGGNLHTRMAAHQKGIERRERERLEAEKVRMAECTFAPSINPKSAAAAASGFEARGDGSAPDRLHHDADARAEQRERARMQSEAWEVAIHPFAPQINPTSAQLAALSQGGGGAERPLHERIDEVTRRREQNVHALRMRVEAEGAATFAPHINSASQALAERRAAAGGSLTASSAGGGGAAERLAADADEKLRRRAERELERRRAEAEVCTFRPAVNALSERLAGDARADGDTVFARLENAERAKEARQRAREAEREAEESQLFKPAISDATDILLMGRQHRLSESKLEQVERLTYVDQQRREALKAQLQSAHYRQFTHAPQIDAISARLARPKTDVELSTNPRGKAIRAEMGAQKAKREAEECTFKPKVAARSAALAAHAAHRSGLQPHQVGTLTERLNLQSQQREAKLDAERKRREAAELEKCTFKPSVKAKSPAAIKAEASGPVVVRGLGRYMELKDLAKRKVEAQKQREQRAFLTEPPEKLQPYTVPEPFQLHEGRGLERRLALERELLAKEAAECPFEPKTNDPPTKALLAKILADSEERQDAMVAAAGGYSG